MYPVAGAQPPGGALDVEPHGALLQVQPPRDLRDRVAPRKDGVVYYTVGDHLGTTSLVLDGVLDKVAESRHYPYGEERWSDGTLPTDYRFTGQREEAALGLYHMGARFYDSYISRFLSPDSIIPDFADPQSLNRYAYCLSNPLRYRDPSGHYHRDVHYEFTGQATFGLTLFTALMRGKGPRQSLALASDVAKQAAAANQAVDDLGPDHSSQRSGVLHWMSHKEATENIAAVVQSGDPAEFGRALHAVQDYFSHFGHGFVLESGEDGQDLYRQLFAQDDFDPLEYGGLSLEDRIENADQWGHVGASRNYRLGLSDFDPDDYNAHDEWDQLMRDESLYWTWLFVQIYFELEPEENTNASANRE